MAPPTSPPLSEPQRESLFVRLLTPLTFFSFLISLFLIDTRVTLQRSSSHSSSINTTTTSTSPSSHPPSTLTLIRSKIHALIYRPSPYAYVSPPTPEPPQHQTLQSVTPDGKATPRVISKEQEPWHLHTQQRKIMRMEVVDAFELRKHVVVVLVLVAALVAGLGLWGMWRSAQVVIWYL